MNVDAVWAEEALRDRGGSMTAEEVRSMVLFVSGSKREAEDAWAKHQAAIDRAEMAARQRTGG